MLRVKIDFGHGAFQIGDGIPDDLQIPSGVQTQGLLGVPLARLAENRPRRRARRNEGVQVGVGIRRIIGMMRAPERGDFGMFQAIVGYLLEKRHVDRVGTGPAALDVVDAELVEAQGDLDFVGRGQVDVFGLRAVAQGRVVQDDLLRHGWVSSGYSAEPQQEHCPPQATGYSPLKQARQYLSGSETEFSSPSMVR